MDIMDTYIIDSIRTPIGNFGGTLKDIRTAETMPSSDYLLVYPKVGRRGQ